MSTPKLVFIFGPQRTGSTLLHDLFKLHPDVYGTPNDLNLWDVSKNLFRIVLDGRQARKFVDWKIPGLSDLYELLLCRDDQAVFKSLMDRYFEGRKESVFVHKNPKAELELDTYRRMFPDGKYIFCVRNPMSIMTSRKYWEQNKSAWVPLDEKSDFTDVILLMKHMRDYVRYIFESYKIIDAEYGKSDVLGIVDYDGLVKEPKVQLQPILSALQIQINPIIDRINALKNPYSSFPENAKKKGLYVSSSMKWKTLLTRFEIELIYNAMSNFHAEYEFQSEVMEKCFHRYLINIRSARPRKG